MGKNIDFLPDSEKLLRTAYEDCGHQLSREYFCFLEEFLALGQVSAEELITLYEEMLDTPPAARSRLLFIAAEEASGASAIGYTSQWADPELAERMLVHSNDEARHMKMLLRAADNFVPDLPRYKPFEVDAEREFAGATSADFLNFFCAVHQAEVRGYASFLLLKRLSEVRQSKAVTYLARILRPVMSDELHHILYTGAQLDRWNEEGVVSYGALRHGFAQFAAFWQGDLIRLNRCLQDPWTSPFDPRLGLPDPPRPLSVN